MCVEASTGQHQGDPGLHPKEVHRTSGSWTILAHEEVPKCELEWQWVEQHACCVVTDSTLSVHLQL